MKIRGHDFATTRLCLLTEIARPAVRPESAKRQLVNLKASKNSDRTDTESFLQYLKLVLLMNEAMMPANC